MDPGTQIHMELSGQGGGFLALLGFLPSEISSSSSSMLGVDALDGSFHTPLIPAEMSGTNCTGNTLIQY